jgi:hypothetical protein
MESSRDIRSTNGQLSDFLADMFAKLSDAEIAELIRRFVNVQITRRINDNSLLDVLNYVLISTKESPEYLDAEYIFDKSLHRTDDIITAGDAEDNLFPVLHNRAFHLYNSDRENLFEIPLKYNYDVRWYITPAKNAELFFWSTIFHNKFTSYGVCTREGKKLWQNEHPKYIDIRFIYISEDKCLVYNENDIIKPYYINPRTGKTSDTFPTIDNTVKDLENLFYAPKINMFYRAIESGIELLDEHMNITYKMYTPYPDAKYLNVKNGVIIYQKPKTK